MVLKKTCELWKATWFWYETCMITQMWKYRTVAISYEVIGTRVEKNASTRIFVKEKIRTIQDEIKSE